MPTIDAMIEHIIELEGGYVDHPNDKGGPTKYGITIKTLSAELGRPATIEDVQALNKGDAAAIYKDDYFYAPKLHRLQEELWPQLFDMSVNHGPGNSIRMLQRVLTMAGFTCAVDGGIGPNTVKAALAAYDAMGGYLINAISEYREVFYNRIVENNPSQNVFIKGWINRAREFRVEVS